jgi:hypothetical protein
MIYGFVKELFRPSGRQRLTVSATVVSLTPPTAASNFAFITVESNPIRWTMEGTNPAAGGPGHLATAGSTITLYGKDQVTKFKAIREAAADATIEVTFGELQ